MAEAKKPTDWERIESDFRAGLLSVREIAATHGISHTAINKRARGEGWDRDLSAKIKAKADALVSKREVSAEVSTQRAETDRAIIEANAEVIANIRLTHRKDIGRARKLAMSLLEEIEAQTGNPEALSVLGELIDTESNAVPEKLMAAFHAVTSLPGRTKTMKDLADTLHKLIGLEREAYNLGHQPNDAPPTPPAAAQGVLVVPADLAEAQRIYQRVMSGPET